MATQAIGVAGATGYAGAELVRLLLSHPRVGAAKLRLYGRADSAAQPLAELHPQFAGAAGSSADDVVVQPLDWSAARDAGVEVMFLATPHEQSRTMVPQALAAGMRVVDLSGAWRLRDARNRAIYDFADEGSPAAEAVQEQAVYGAPELHADCIRQARLVANPGCYATSVILALAPLLRAGLVDEERGIVADSKSGVSGAGKAATAKTHFMYAADNLSAYSVFSHRHTGELLEQLHIRNSDITFTPHLLPIPRGILSTIYVNLRDAASAERISHIYESFYAGGPMVRLRGAALPQIQWVANTNYCDIGFALEQEGKRLVIVSCLDNLLKGAASQAVENMNLMLGFEHSEGLR